MEENVKLYRPLEEDIITISNTKSDGTVNFKHVKIDDSIAKLEKLIHDSEVKLTRLDRELEGVNEEIDATLDRYNKATKSVGDAYLEKIKEHQEKAIAFHKFMHDQVAKARKDDKAYGVEANRKLQAFVASLI
jgi:chromosome segregation ATPase